MDKIYFWEKLAYKPEEEEKDKLNFYVVGEEDSDTSDIREVIRNLEGKILGKKLLFSDVKPQNSSVKGWINSIMLKYPKLDKKSAEDLLNTFRAALYPRSREKHKFIVGLLLLKDVLILAHCTKDASLAEFEDKIYSVKLILHQKNVIRAAIIKNENGKITFSAFERNKRWTKGHAEFWGIEPEEVSWESLGNIILVIGVEGFPYPVQLPVESEQLNIMIRNQEISPTGKIKIGREEGTIQQVEVFRKTMDFSEFYDFYINEKERLEEHRKKFSEIIEPHSVMAYEPNYENYKYKEDAEKLFEITPKGDKPIHDKRHPRYLVSFFTNSYPRIKPTQAFLTTLYRSIFENTPLEMWHAGEESSLDPIKIGSLDVYNKMDVPAEIEDFTNQLLNYIQDSQSKKTKAILQYYFCDIWRMNLKKNQHFQALFEFIQASLLRPEIEYLFKNDAVFDKENYLEFKSASIVSSSPKKFAIDTLIPTVKKYVQNGELKRFCIVYGVEDDGQIIPIYHLKSDMITQIEEIANNELSKDNIRVTIQPIPFKEGRILCVFLYMLHDDRTCLQGRFNRRGEEGERGHREGL
jgi:hypothetical protein